MDKAVVAVQAMGTFRGGSQSQLLICDDGRLWVVKFKNNPQGSRTLVNDFVGSRLGGLLGLSMPETNIVEVGRSLIAKTPELWVSAAQGERAPCAHGANFGSLYVAGLMPLRVVRDMHVDQLDDVRNLNEFAGVLALDKWLSNIDRRQAVFWQGSRDKYYRVSFIDQGHCFSGTDWAYRDSPLGGLYHYRSVYESIVGWESFEPWLSRLEAISIDDVYRVVRQVPTEWYDGDLPSLSRLVEQLFARKRRVRELILDIHNSIVSPFVHWTYTRTALPRPPLKSCA